MAVHSRSGLRPGVRACAQVAAIPILCGVLLFTAAPGARATPAMPAMPAMPAISIHKNHLYAGARPWRAWGMNWGIGNHAPVIAYFDDPTPARLAALRAELRVARRLGANSMRVYLQLGQVMSTPSRVRARTLTALRRLLWIAQADRIYLDITGDLVWRPSRSPAWYAHMGWPQRWNVQARFWKAVARTAAGAPAVLCYELTSEPIIAQSPGYYYYPIGNWYFVQSMATAPASEADRLARAWTRKMAAAVRSEDHRPVTIGLMAVTTGPFSPANVGDLLDMLTVHVYPTTGQAASAITLVDDYAAFHKPVLLGETFGLFGDLDTEGQFLLGAGPALAGTFEFFNGRDPRTMAPRTIADMMYQQSLEQFIQLRAVLERD